MYHLATTAHTDLQGHQRSMIFISSEKALSVINSNLDPITHHLATIHFVSEKKRQTLLFLYLHKILTDFQNSFTSTLSGQLTTE